MVTKLVCDLDLDTDNLTLKEAINKIQIDKQSDIPFIIKLLENPSSIVALPGKINLYNHDCIHTILGCGVSLEEEAFVVGFTMGNDVKTNKFHLAIYKFFSRFIYPSKYKFNKTHLRIFDIGFSYGRKQKSKNINYINFKSYERKTIAELRKYLGINIDELILHKEISNYITKSFL